MTEILTFVAIGLAAVYALMVLYYFVGWLRLKKDDKPQTTDHKKQPFISIVIPVRNESEHIKACLESIFKQNYPEDLYEVIVIDDYSTDPTLRFAREFERPNLTVLDLMQYLGNPGEYVPNKKKAIALGVKNAKGDVIITTDGDCTMGENWLATMATAYNKGNARLLTGPVMIKPAKGPFAWFQQLDVISLAGITAATIRNGSPTMCNGANLMYAKQTFLDVEGFKGNHDMPTGDDIFLMQKIMAKYAGSMAYVKNYDACVFTKPESGLGNFVSQRLRWISKSSRFSSFSSKLTLYFAYLFNVAIVASGVYYAVFPFEMNWLPLAITGGTKVFIDFVFNVPVTYFFRKLVLLLLLPIIEVFHIIYVILIGLLSLMGRYRWKDRLIK